MKTRIIKADVIFITITILVLISIVVIFVPTLYSLNNKYFKITSSDKLINNTLIISDLALKPGEQKSTNLTLDCLVTGKYKIVFSFQEQYFQDLNDYIIVIIKNDEKVFFEENLNYFFNNHIYVLNDFKKGNVENIEIIYILPYDVGNEAQGKYTNLQIKITIEKEWSYENKKNEVN